MSLQLSMIGIVVDDMKRSLEFYRRLGLEFPDGSNDLPHVQMEMPGGIVLFWNTSFLKTDDPDRVPPAGGYRVILEFFLEGREAIDAKYEELIGHGYRSHKAPWLTSFGAYMAMVDDPDGNTIMITAGQG